MEHEYSAAAKKCSRRFVDVTAISCVRFFPCLPVTTLLLVVKALHSGDKSNLGTFCKRNLQVRLVVSRCSSTKVCIQKSGYPQTQFASDKTLLNLCIIVA